MKNSFIFVMSMVFCGAMGMEELSAKITRLSLQERHGDKAARKEKWDMIQLGTLLSKIAHYFPLEYERIVKEVFPLDRLFCQEFAHGDCVRAASLSADGSKLVTGCDDRKARIWDLNDGSCQQFEHERRVYAVSMSPDGSKLMTRCDDGMVRIFNLRNGLCQQVEHKDCVYAASLSADGSKLITGCDDGKARVWDINNGSCQQFEHEDWVNTAGMSLDGSKFITGCNDGKACIWDLNNGSCQQFEHEDCVYAASLSADGSKLVTGCNDKKARIWDLKWRDNFNCIQNVLVEKRKHLAALYAGLHNEFKKNNYKYKPSEEEKELIYDEEIWKRFTSWQKKQLHKIVTRKLIKRRNKLYRKKVSK